jgi:uncharacterized protein (TIGR02444 family)
MDEPENTDDDDALWRFSLAFYDRPGVAQALITLQDRDGLDVNVMLFALWYGISGGGALSTDTLAAAEQATGTLRNEIVVPLRRLRRKLRYHTDCDVQQLREGVKALELAGERLAQSRLARLRTGGGAYMSPAELRAAAHANLALYLSAEGIRSREAAVIAEAFDAFVRDV